MRTPRQGAAWFPTVVEGEDALLAAMPFFHSYGLLAMNLTILIGAKLIPIPNPRDIHMILEITQDEKPSLFPGVPRLYIAVNEHPDASKFDLKSMKACVSGAAPLPAAVAKEFERVTGGAQLVEGYGLTECSPVTHVNPFNGVRSPGRSGLPVPDTDVRIMSIDDPDKVMPQGEPGELCIKGPQVMLGYWRRPEETALAIRNGWFHTGDVAVIDADGYFRIVDRLKDMILVSGFNVYPNEVEDVLYHHPAISKCAVVGLPDERTGERVKAFVVLKEGASLTAEDLIAWCKDPDAGAHRLPRAEGDRVPRLAAGDAGRQGAPPRAAGGGAAARRRQRRREPAPVGPRRRGRRSHATRVDDAEELYALVDANRDAPAPVDDLGAHHQDGRATPGRSSRRVWPRRDFEGNGLWVDGAIAGGIGLTIDTLANSGEIGYWLAEDTRAGGRHARVRAVLRLRVRRARAASDGAAGGGRERAEPCRRRAPRHAAGGCRARRLPGRRRLSRSGRVRHPGGRVARAEEARMGLI